jgi:hypothetical protein
MSAGGKRPNPYESPKARSLSVNWRARFRWLCIRSFIVAAVSFAVSQLIEYAAPAALYDRAAFLVFRGFVALGALAAMTASGSFGIGWALGRRQETK